MERIININYNLFYVVSQNMDEEGNWEQLSNGFDDYYKAVEFKNSSFCKKRWPKAFIVASLK